MTDSIINCGGWQLDCNGCWWETRNERVAYRADDGRECQVCVVFISLVYQGHQQEEERERDKEIWNLTIKLKIKPWPTKFLEKKVMYRICEDVKVMHRIFGKWKEKKCDERFVLLQNRYREHIKSIERFRANWINSPFFFGLQWVHYVHSKGRGRSILARVT